MTLPLPQPTGLQRLAERLNSLLADDALGRQLNALATKPKEDRTAADAMAIAQVRQGLQRVALRAQWWQGRVS